MIDSACMWQVGESEHPQSGMNHRRATWVTIAVSLLAICLTTTASLYLAFRQNRHDAAEQTATVAAESLRRADSMTGQALLAYARLTASTSTNPCSAQRLSLMSDVALDYDYVQAVGYVVDDRVICSSSGLHDPGIPLGPPLFPTGNFDANIRPSVDLGTGKRFLVLQRGHYAAAISPASLLDILSPRSGMSYGIFGIPSGRVVSNHGFFDRTWPQRLGDAHRVTFYDGKYLVSIESSTKYSLAAFSAIPKADLHAGFLASARILLPIGLLLGLLASFAIFRLARRRETLPATLRSALERREFVLHYQPIVEMATARIAGAEALLRWPREDGNGMRPALFIPAAEDCGLIQHFTAYVLQELANEAAAFFRLHPDCYISINLASADLHDEHTVSLLRELLGTPGIEPHNLVVEVTEHSFLEPARASRTIRGIRELGVRVAIDDFGTGFSSLSHLTTLQTDFLKIDKLFIDSVGTSSVTSEVALHIIGMARTLGQTVIAEGVETRLQADFLREHGVVLAQGWLFSTALPMSRLLREWPSD
ncbi:MAG TPA: EAL domain-containing protein [Rhodanobacter sp.]|nr:EAL domain-containing protein [Rhodanobacter sp.]